MEHSCRRQRVEVVLVQAVRPEGQLLISTSDQQLIEPPLVVANGVPVVVRALLRTSRRCGERAEVCPMTLCSPSERAQVNEASAREFSDRGRVRRARRVP